MNNAPSQTQPVPKVEPLTFTDPVKALPETEQVRTSFWGSKGNFAFLRALRGRPGTLETTINILLYKLEHELKRNGITSYASGTYEHAVEHCTITLGVRSTATGAPTGSGRPSAVEANSGNDRRGTQRVARKASRPE